MKMTTIIVPYNTSFRVKYKAPRENPIIAFNPATAIKRSSGFSEYFDLVA